MLRVAPSEPLHRDIFGRTLFEGLGRLCCPLDLALLRTLLFQRIDPVDMHLVPCVLRPLPREPQWDVLQRTEPHFAWLARHRAAVLEDPASPVLVRRDLQVEVAAVGMKTRRQ